MCGLALALTGCGVEQSHAAPLARDTALDPCAPVDAACMGWDVYECPAGYELRNSYSGAVIRVDYDRSDPASANVVRSTLRGCAP